MCSRPAKGPRTAVSADTNRSGDYTQRKAITHEYRLMWAMETSTRDIPVACASLVNNLMQSVSFYASTTIYIIAGLIAVIGTIDRLEVFTADLPFATRPRKSAIHPQKNTGSSQRSAWRVLTRKQGMSFTEAFEPTIMASPHLVGL